VLASKYQEFDVVVVDQSDDDSTGALVRTIAELHPDRVTYVHTMPPGLSRAYNIGIASSTGDVLAFTDDDCIAPDDWMTSIVAAFTAEPEADMLYGQVNLPASLENHRGIVPTLDIPEPRRLSRADGFRIYGMGANFAVRRRLFERIGGFDEMLGGGGPLRSSQDFDFQYRAYVAGATTLLRPDVKVDHYGLRTGEQWPATLRAYGIGDGAFYSKHVRCGDLFALRLLAVRLGRMAAREALLALGIRKRGSQQIYLKGCLEGIRAGLRYPVDRQRRLYGPTHSLAEGSVA
jgi:GT2 family glycosyltransferase